MCDVVHGAWNGATCARGDEPRDWALSWGSSAVVFSIGQQLPRHAKLHSNELLYGFW